jgi:PadR family transcriptional regulator PadR
MTDDPRMTLQTQLVLRAFLDAPREEQYGLELAKASGLPTGSIYPILARLEAAGWITSDWEMIDERAEGRPRRRYYRLTSYGARASKEALERTRTRMFPSLTKGHAQ